MEYVDLVLQALKYVIAAVFVTSAIIGLLIVTSNFLRALFVGEHLLRFIAGDNPNRLQAILLTSGVAFTLAGFALVSPGLLAPGFILLSWAGLHYHYHWRRGKSPRRKK